MKKKLISSLLAFSLATSSFVSATIFPEVTANDDGGNGTNTGSSATQEEFAKFRESFLSGNQSNAISTINSGSSTSSNNDFESSRIVHHTVPQIDVNSLDSNSTFSPSNDVSTIADTGYEVDDTRTFYTAFGGNSYVNKEGTLKYQSDHTNVWLIGDDVTTTGVLNDDMYKAIAEKSDEIYELMIEKVAPHIKVENAGSSNLPNVGDVDDDGKINILLYDLFGDGDSSSNSYTAGYFHNANQINTLDNPIDCLHMDIGVNQCYKDLTENDGSGFYGTLAHEFQHLLFYTYLGYKTNNEMTWINESLSGVADLYFGAGEYTGNQTPDVGKFIYSNINDYTGGTTFGSDGYGDFVSHNGSTKNYGMDYLFATMLHQKDETYITEMYKYFETISKGNTQTNPDLFGGAFKSVFSDLSSYENTEAFEYLYRLFMETFISDGGTLEGNTSTSYDSLWYGDKLWNFRGYGTDHVSYSSYANTADYTTINDGDKITMKYTTNITLNSAYTNVVNSATREMAYKIESGASDELIIKVGDSSTPSALFPYVVLYNETDRTGDVYPLTLNEESTIDTEGRDVYLFVSTYFQDVENVPVAIDWAEPDKESLEAPTISDTGNLTVGGTLTLGVATDITSGYSTQWYTVDSLGEKTKIDGETNDTFTITSAEIGATIVVGVTPISTDENYKTEEVFSAELEIPDDRADFPAVAIAFADDKLTLTIGGKSVSDFKETFTDFTITWYTVDDEGVKTAVSGADSDSILIGVSNFGKTYIAGVTPGVDNADYKITEAFSNSYSVEDTRENVPTPTITGNAVVGQELSMAVDFPSGFASYDTQWYTVSASGDEVEISGATGSTLTLTDSHIGSKIKVSVTPTQSNELYKAEETFSSTTATVEESGDFTSYTITLNNDGTTSTLTTDKDGKITLPATPTKADDVKETVEGSKTTTTTTSYTFEEWNTSEDGKGATVTSNTAFNEDTEIFAIWSEIITVTVIVEVVVNESDVKVEDDSAVVDVSVPTADTLGLESYTDVEEIVVEIDLSSISGLDEVGTITLSESVVNGIKDLTAEGFYVAITVPTNNDTDSLDTTFDYDVLKDVETTVTWVFDSNVTVTNGINLAVSLFDAVVGDISDIIEDVVTNDFSSLNDTIGLLNFSHNGSLGGDIEVQVDVNDLANFTKGTESAAYLYKLKKGSVETTPIHGTIDENGILTVGMTSCSDYLVTTSPLNINVVNNSYVPNSTSTTTSSGNTYSSANHYSTGSISIPSLGYISEFRNILLGELINLDKIDVNGMEILGWYYDADFTMPVENTSMFVVNQAVLDGGLFPKFATTVSDTLIDGSVNAGYVDSLTDTNTSYIPTAVPSTIAKLLGKLF